MSTSGDSTFCYTRDEVITKALRIIGVLHVGEEPSPDDIETCSLTLNMMIKNWQADGLNLYAVETNYLYLNKNQRIYTLGGDSSDAYSTDYNTAVTTVAAIATDTTLTLDSVTNIEDGTNIVVVLDTGSFHRTTVNGAPAGLVVTLTDAMPSAAALGNRVYFYNTAAERPLKIFDSVVRDQSDIDIPIDMLTRTEYTELSNKTVPGKAVQGYYDPQHTAGKFYTWPLTNTANDYLVLRVQRQLDTFVEKGDEVDFPQEWYLPLSYGLGNYVATEYGTPERLHMRVAALAEKLYNSAWNFDREELVEFSPDFTRNG